MQHKEAAAKRVDNAHEMRKPMARYSDDNDLNSLLKERPRLDDPMSKLAGKQKKSSKFLLCGHLQGFQEY